MTTKTTPQNTESKTSNGLYALGLQELQRVSNDDRARQTVDKDFSEARGRETARLHVTLKTLAALDQNDSDRTGSTLAALRELAASLQKRADGITQLTESFQQEAGKSFKQVQNSITTRSDGIEKAIATRTDSLEKSVAARSDVLEKLAVKHADAAENADTKRADAIAKQVTDFAKAETAHHDALTKQVATFEKALSTQLTESRTALAKGTADGVESLTKRVEKAEAALLKRVQDAQESLQKQADTNFNSLAEQERDDTSVVRRDLHESRDEIVRLVDSRMNQSDASFAAVRADMEVLKFMVMDLIKDRIGRRSDPTGAEASRHK